MIQSQQGVPSLKSCWDQKHNVMVSYDYPANQHIEIWGKIAYYYGNTMDPNKVQSQLRLNLEKRGKPRGELLPCETLNILSLKIEWIVQRECSLLFYETYTSYIFAVSNPTGFIVCGLNLTLPADSRILLYILRMCDNFPNVVHRSLPRLLRWVKEQAVKTPMNIVASDIVTRDQFVPIVVNLNISKQA